MAIQSQRGTPPLLGDCSGLGAGSLVSAVSAVSAILLPSDPDFTALESPLVFSASTFSNRLKNHRPWIWRRHQPIAVQVGELATNLRLNRVFQFHTLVVLNQRDM